MSGSRSTTSLADLTPRHDYDPALETGENLFATRFGDLDDAAWLDVLRRSISEPSIDGVEFPRFPDMNLQSRIHGTSGANALDEILPFYEFSRAHTYRDAGTDLRLLDFGSGWGRLTRFFLRDFRLGNVYGFEPNPLFCSIARALNPYVCFVGSNQSTDDALPADWFDVVVGYSVFSHLSEQSAPHWLAVLNRALRPGGWCVLTTYGWRFLNWLREHELKLDGGEDIHWYAEACVRNAGDIQARCDQFEAGEFVFFGDSESYGDACIPAAKLASFLAAPGLDLELITFDTTSLPQDAFVLRRPID